MIDVDKLIEECPIAPKMDKVVIIRDEPDRKLGSYIEAADTHLQKPLRATVIASGPGRYTESGLFLKNESVPGDRVLVPLIDLLEQEIEGVNYSFICESDIICTYIKKEVMANA